MQEEKDKIQDGRLPFNEDCGSLDIKCGFVSDVLIFLPGGGGLPPPTPLHLYIIFTC